MNDNPKEAPPSFSDETLSAYLDGELDAAQALKVDQALASDASLRARLARIREVDVALNAALALDQMETPQRVEQLLREAPDVSAGGDQEAHGRPGAESGAEIVRPFAFFKTRPLAPMAMAASVALFAGYAIGALQPAQPVAPLAIAGLIYEDHPLFAVLETTPSGVAAALAGAEGRVARPLVSYAAQDGSLCREFEAGDAARSVRGVACRGEGAWEIRLAASGGGLLQNEAGGYQTASAGDVSFIADYVDATIEGDPLGPEDEDNAMKLGWRPASNQ